MGKYMDGLKSIGKSVFSKRVDTVQTNKSKSDGLINVITALGVTGRDKRQAAEFTETLLNDSTLEIMYRNNDITQRIINRVPYEMMREGFEIKISDVENANDISAEAMNFYKQFNGEAKFMEAIQWARLFGSAGVVLGFKGVGLAEPIDDCHGKEIEYLIVMDKTELNPKSTDIVSDLSSKYFGKPEFYTINSTDKTESVDIHVSRFLRFDGVTLPYKLMRQNNYWGDSVIKAIYESVRDYEQSFKSLATITTDGIQKVAKIEGLMDLIASGEEDLVIARFQATQLYQSVLNMMVLDKNDDYQVITSNMTGYNDAVMTAGNRLVAAVDMPHTVLLGESPSGSNATGNSSMLNWYDTIRNMQYKMLEPQLRIFFDAVFAQMGKSELNYEIKFLPLWQATEKEQAETRKIMSEADGNYADRGILSVDEIAESRFGGDGFSVDTTIDGELREEIASVPNNPDEIVSE